MFSKPQAAQKLTVCVNGRTRIARFLHIRLRLGIPGSADKSLYGNPLDFSKIYDIVMNNEIKLTYVLFSMYLSVLCCLGPFGAIWSHLEPFIEGQVPPGKPSSVCTDHPPHSKMRCEILPNCL